jgi:hypothetical protein
MTESNFRTQIINIFLVGHNFFSLYYYYFSYVLLTKGPPLIHLIIFLTFCCHWGSQHHNKHANKELWNEAVTYGDIQILPFIDDYDLIVFKTVAVCMYAVSISHPQFRHAFTKH